VQGFGNVGSYAAETLAERGLKIIGVSDHTACYFDPRGLDVPALLKHAQEKGVLAGFSNQLSLDPVELLMQKCDVLVPAAVERVIDASVAARLQCRVLAEAANGPTTPDADEVLEQRRGEIFVIPDILCNAGGVVVSYFEWVQDLQSFFWPISEVNSKLETVMRQSFQDVHESMRKHRAHMRTGAYVLAVGRVADATLVRGLFP
jgi:glutamate dehydrogenase (NAD(P)+)